MKREFASLSAQEALHLAIFIEERNGGLYRQFAELFKDFGDRDSLMQKVRWAIDSGLPPELQEHQPERQARIHDERTSSPPSLGSSGSVL